MIRRPTPKLLIFDVDGTLRRTTVAGLPCPNNADQWELMPNVSETLSLIDWGPRGTRLGVASNQGGVALGYIAEERARSLIEDAVKAAIGFIPPDALIKMCTCAPESNCACRKPNPGMLLDIIHESGVKRKDALFVGDHAKDREAARRARVPFEWANDFFGWDE